MPASPFRPAFLAVAVIGALAACNFAGARSKSIALPDAKLDAPLKAANSDAASSNAVKPDDAVAVFAGGCFWGVEAVFEHVKGVKQATSGYAGGDATAAQYDTVSTGETGHAESVKVVYDPAKVSYGQLLKVYFSVAHDPTQLNRQSPDVGTQYRSEIFTTNATQAKIANAYIAQLTAAKVFAAPIVTKVAPLPAFYPAEAHHQDYLRLHPNEPYIVYNDAPKLVHLKELFPALYKGG
ncbi:MAG TPA: peptide-methionine (S)-S-oxide reductase MsrA [Luteimonas sp.]|nr:peptide-methionine (S)-S-oxide reductase MsrA [Luteimonas sp.]